MKSVVYHCDDHSRFEGAEHLVDDTPCPRPQAEPDASSSQGGLEYIRAKYVLEFFRSEVSATAYCSVPKRHTQGQSDLAFAPLLDMMQQPDAFKGRPQLLDQEAAAQPALANAEAPSAAEFELRVPDGFRGGPIEFRTRSYQQVLIA